MQIPFLAHAQMIEELSATPLEIGYEKTLHIIFPTEVKYCNAGNDHILAEKVSAQPNIIRIIAAERLIKLSRPRVGCSCAEEKEAENFIIKGRIKKIQNALPAANSSVANDKSQPRNFFSFSYKAGRTNFLT